MAEIKFKLNNDYAFDASKLPAHLAKYADNHAKIDGVICVKTPSGYEKIPDDAVVEHLALPEDTVLIKTVREWSPHVHNSPRFMKTLDARYEAAFGTKGRDLG